MIESNAYSQLLDIIRRDYPTYSGRALKEYFKCWMREEGRYTNIGSWWDRKGENEIDIIAEDELSKTLSFVEVKRQEPNIDHAILRSKADVFLHSIKHDYSQYDLRYLGLSLHEI